MTTSHTKKEVTTMIDKTPVNISMNATEEKSSQFVKEANRKIIGHVEELRNRSEQEIDKLRRKITISYWISVTLSIVMFIAGLVLLSVPLVAPFRGEIDTQASLISGGVGIADLAVLFLVGPIKRIHKYMGDIAQITLVINSFQNQVALRFLEADIMDRTTIGNAAELINKVAEDSSILIQKYFEETE